MSGGRRRGGRRKGEGERRKVNVEESFEESWEGFVGHF